MSKLAPINKTHLMLLLEARDPRKRDIRLIVREAYEQGGGYEGASDFIFERYGERVTISALHDWFTAWGWNVRRVLVTPGVPAEVAA